LSLRSNHGLKLANAFGVLWTNFNLRHYPPLRSLAGFHARARLVRSLRQPDFNVGLVEDLVAIGQSVHRFEILVQRPIPLTNESRVAVKHLKSQFVTASDNP